MDWYNKPARYIRSDELVDGMVGIYLANPSTYPTLLITAQVFGVIDMFKSEVNKVLLGKVGVGSVRIIEGDGIG